MQFNSMDFMIFFPIVVAVYFIIPKKRGGGNLAVNDQLLFLYELES